MKVLIGSNNRHKLQELCEIWAAAGMPLATVAPGEVGIQIDPDETAGSYAGNALLKARAFAEALRRRPEAGIDWVMADDSGLEVDALGGAPGVLSSRYHKQSPGGDGCARLLETLAGIPDERRAARFQAVIVVVDRRGDEHLFTGACEGRIAREKRGGQGFGFDPVFVPGDGERTMAELTAAEKHRISHRGMAARRAGEFLRAAGQAQSNSGAR